MWRWARSHSSGSGLGGSCGYPLCIALFFTETGEARKKGLCWWKNTSQYLQSLIGTRYSETLLCSIKLTLQAGWMGLNGDEILPSKGMISSVGMISRFRDSRFFATLLSASSHIRFSLLIPEIALLSASSHGLTKSYSFMSTVKTRISSDNAESLNCLGLFLLGFLCLYASWEINAQRTNLCISDLHAVPAEQQ